MIRTPEQGTLVIGKSHVAKSRGIGLLELAVFAAFLFRTLHGNTVRGLSVQADSSGSRFQRFRAKGLEFRVQGLRFSLNRLGYRVWA